MVFPAPLEPTMATIVPAATRKSISFRTASPSGAYRKSTRSKTISFRIGASVSAPSASRTSGSVSITSKTRPPAASPCWTTLLILESRFTGS